MRSVFFLLSVALLVASASAEQRRPLQFDQSGKGKALPVKEPRSDYSCATYGPGFVKIAGTDTCAKVGGAVSVGAGSSVGGSGARR